MPRLVGSTDRYGRWDKLKIYIFVFVLGFPITIRLFFIFYWKQREEGSWRQEASTSTFLWEIASPHRQSPDWRFQLQRHACEMTSCDFNCLAVGNKVFRQGNANCLPAWPWRAGQYASLWSAAHCGVASQRLLRVRTVNRTIHVSVPDVSSH